MIEVPSVNFHDNFINNISKKDFFAMLKFFDFDIEAFFINERKVDVKSINDFNILLLSIHRDFEVSLVDCITYIEEDFANFASIMSVLDSNVKVILKKELIQRNNLKIAPTIADKFFQ